MRMTIFLTSIAMTAFAANSLLARTALAGNTIDALTFTAIRLTTGALALTALLIRQRGHSMLHDRPGNWPSALALLVYALAFSLAYSRLGVATGTLVLFAAVQATMILWGIVKRDRPNIREIVGLAIAFATFVYLLLPRLDTPDSLGSCLMISSGIAWGTYSLRGRGTSNPLSETTGNFVRATLLFIPIDLLAVLQGHTTMLGFTLAVLSGVVASGFGYAVWYRALPGLSTTQAATVQLTVPIIAALGAVVFLSETLTMRLLLVSICLLGGVALALLSRRPVK